MVSSKFKSGEEAMIYLHHHLLKLMKDIPNMIVVTMDLNQKNYL